MPQVPMVSLSMLTMQDAAAHLAGEDDELVQWLNGGPGTASTVDAHLRRCVEQWRSGGPAFAFGIRAGSAEVLAGTIEVQFCQPYLGPGQVNISYGVYPTWRGRGLASRAVELACEFAKARGARQAVIRAEPGNLASVAVARRCGFRYLHSTDDSGTELQWWVRDLTPVAELPDLPFEGLVLLVGPPGVGKSTFAGRLVRDGRIDSAGIVSADKLKHELFPGITDSDIRDPAVFAEVDRRVRERLAGGLAVVVDATNVRAEARIRLISIAHELGRPVTAVRFAAALPVALVRNAARDARLPDATVREYAELMRAQASEHQLTTEGAVSVVTVI